LRAAIEILERRQGIDYFPPVSPQAPDVPSPLVSVLDLRRTDRMPAPERAVDAARLANSVTVLLDAEDAAPPRFARLGEWAAFLMEAAPYTCWRLVVQGGGELAPEARRRLCGLFHFPGHILNQSSYLRGGGDAGEPVSVRFFQTPGPDAPTGWNLGAPREKSGKTGKNRPDAGI